MKKKINLTGPEEERRANIQIKLDIKFASSVSIRNILTFLADNVNYSFDFDQCDFSGKTLSVSCTSVEALDDLVKVIKEIR